MIQRKTQSKQKKHICIVPACKREQRTRGICATCYASHRLAIKRGETTWDELAKAGLVLPERNGVAAKAREEAGIGGGSRA